MSDMLNEPDLQTMAMRRVKILLQDIHTIASQTGAKYLVGIDCLAREAINILHEALNTPKVEMRTSFMPCIANTKGNQ